MTTELPVITVILPRDADHGMTELIGVHTALQCLRGRDARWAITDLDRAYRRPAPRFYHRVLQSSFFAVAGLNMDLSTLLDPTLLLFTLAIIAVASIGKFGAFAGGGWAG